MKTYLNLKIFSSVLLVLELAACNKINKTDYIVMRGPFMQSVVETGELQAVNASTLMMPRINSVYSSTLKIINLADHGKVVQKGEPVVTFDPSSVQKYIIEKRESLENEVAAANKLSLQLANSMQDLRAQLRNEQAQFEIKKLDLQKSGFESSGVRKVIELEYKQAEIKLNRLKRAIETRPKLDSLDYRIQKIKVNQKENELKTAIETLDQLTINSPLEGIFVIAVNPRTNQTIKIGDEMYLGYAVARIPDINRMKVTGFITENDISRIRPGQPVIIRLDALPSIPFHGKISQVSKVCILKDLKKVFTTEVLITENDPRLKPGMTVSCEYITAESDDELYVPSECIHEENNRYYIYIKRRGKIKKSVVSPGISNNLYTTVSGDVERGQYLVLPEDILNQQ